MRGGEGEVLFVKITEVNGSLVVQASKEFSLKNFSKIIWSAFRKYLQTARKKHEDIVRNIACLAALILYINDHDYLFQCAADCH